MTLHEARIKGDQVKCWHCPCTLGQIVNGVFAAQAVYRQAPVPAAFAALGIRTVLMVPPHVRDRLERTGLPFSSKIRPTLDKDGGKRVVPTLGYAMPALLPCWRPGCGEPNRVDTAVTTG